MHSSYLKEEIPDISSTLFSLCRTINNFYIYLLQNKNINLFLKAGINDSYEFTSTTTTDTSTKFHVAECNHFDLDNGLCNEFNNRPMCFYDGGDCVGMNFLCYPQSLRDFPILNGFILFYF